MGRERVGWVSPEVEYSFAPDAGQKDESAFSNPRSAFKEAKVSKDNGHESGSARCDMGSKQLSLSDLLALLVRRLVRRSVVVGLLISLTMIALISVSGQSASGVPDRDRRNLALIDSLLHQSYEFTQQGKYEEALPLAERVPAFVNKL